MGRFEESHSPLKQAEEDNPGDQFPKQSPEKRPIVIFVKYLVLQ